MKRLSLRTRAIKYARGRWQGPLGIGILEDGWLAGYLAAQRDAKKKKGKARKGVK